MDSFLHHFLKKHVFRGQRIGYVRITGFDQNPQRQLN